MTALDRRLQKVEEALSPTELAVRWLEEVKQHESFGAYCEQLKEHPSTNPIVSLPPLAARAAGLRPGGRHDPATTERVERGVRSVLMRVLLVERMNWQLAWSIPTDENRLELLRLMEPLVLAGRTDQVTSDTWVEHAGHLLDETLIWQTTASLIGDRYFPGHSPLFPDIAEDLELMRAACDGLLAAYNRAVARPRGRKPKGEAVDRAIIEAHAAELVEPHVVQLVEIARVRLSELLAEQRGVFAIERLVHIGEEP